MPVNKVSFSSVLGTRTEGANTSQELRPPNSMFDARNVVCREPGQLSSREGTEWSMLLPQDHEQCLITNIEAISGSLKSKVGADMDIIHIGNDTASPVQDMYFNSKDTIAGTIYPSGADATHVTTVNRNFAIGTNGAVTATRTAGNALQWPVSGRSPSPISNKLCQFYPKYFANNSYRFVGCSNGTYKISTYLDGVSNEYKSAMRHAAIPPPEIIGVVEKTGSDSIFRERGRSADFVAVIAFEQPDGRMVYSKNSTKFTYTAANYNAGVVHIGVAYDLTNIPFESNWADLQTGVVDFTKFYLQIYRTKTYKQFPDIGPDGVETAPIEPVDPTYYLCYEEQLNQSKVKNHYLNSGDAVTGWYSVGSNATVVGAGASTRTIQLNTTANPANIRYNTLDASAKIAKVDFNPIALSPGESFAVGDAEFTEDNRIYTYMTQTLIISAYVASGVALATISSIQIVDAYPTLINDDGLILQTQLYTNVNQEGIGSESYVAPIAGSITSHKEYAIYSNVIKPPVGILVPITYNKTETTAKLTVSSTTVNLSLEDENQDITALNIKGIPNILSWFGTATAQQVRDGISDIYPFAASALANTAFAKVADPSSDFTIVYTIGSSTVNPGLFLESGGSLVISDVSNNAVVDVITYKSLSRSVAAGVVTMTFKDCSYLRSWVAGLAAANYNVRCLTPVVGDTLPAYLTYSGNTIQLSIVPISDTASIKFPIGFYTALATSAGFIRGTLTYKGPLVRSDYDWLQEQYFKMVRDYNMYRDPVRDPVAYISSDFDFSVSFVSIFYGAYKSGSLSPGVSGGYGVGGLTLNAQLTGTSVKYFSQALTNSVPITEDTSHIMNGIIPSHNGRFETTPFEYARKPFKVGREDTAILATASANGEFYVFKDKEGIYRLSIQDSIGYPDIVNATLLDNTYHCIAPNSVQVLESNVIFLSNRGVVAITPNQSIVELSKNTETDLLELVDGFAYSNASLDAGSPSYGTFKETESTLKADIKSAVSPSRRLYMLYIPQQNLNKFKLSVTPYTQGVTYVFDAHTGEWSKWDIPILAGCELDSRLYMATNVLKQTGAIGGSETTATVDRTTQIASGVLKDRSSGFAKNVKSTYANLNDGIFTMDVSVVDQSVKYVTNLVGFFNKNVGTYEPNLDPKVMFMQTRRGPELYAAAANDVDYKHQLKGRRIYVRDGNGVLLPFDTWAFEDLGPFIKITLISNSKYVYDTYKADSVAIQVIVGVSVDLTTNRFYAAGGVGKARFIEGQVLIQEDLTYVRQSFSNNAANDFSIWSQAAGSRDVVRTWVPTDASLGRYVLSRIQHSTPGERFDIIGLNYVYRDLGTFRTSKGNEV